MLAETLIAPVLPTQPFSTSDLPYASEQGFMLPQQMNVFACHADRVDDLIAHGFTGMGRTHD